MITLWWDTKQIGVWDPGMLRILYDGLSNRLLTTIREVCVNIITSHFTSEVMKAQRSEKWAQSHG